MNRFLFLMAFLLSSAHAWAQEEIAFILQFDNDAFLEKDHYYSNGLAFSFYSPSLEKNPINKILIGRSDDFLSGLALEHYIFTPISKESDTAVIGDRPFSAVLQFRTEKISAFENERMRLYAGLDIGLTGKAALGNEVQNAIHDLLPTSDPVDGWSYVQPTSLGLNYDVSMAYLWIKSSYFEMRTNTDLAIGTVKTYANLGLHVRLGKIIPWTDYYINPEHGWQLFLFAEASSDLIIYNASLQGGVFTDGSINKISASDLNRIVPKYSYGLGVQFKKMSLGLSINHIAPEFTTSESHAWGSVLLNYNF